MECQQCNTETDTAFFVYSPLVVCGKCYVKLMTGEIKPKELDVSAKTTKELMKWKK